VKPSTGRQKALAKALTALIPLAPFSDAEAIRDLAGQRKLRDLPPSIALWIATITHVRHEHSDYDALLDEGYDRDSARHFVVDQMNAVLTNWRATRLVEADEDEGE
jgi:hypothetical protein